ncbi:MAG: sigma-70 family RNA polymerase sigma factor [Christensenella sp.]
MKSEAEIIKAVDMYSDMLRRVCFVYLKNEHDSEDIFQEVFIKYALHKKEFDSREHEKAWLLRVCINKCKDWLKSAARKNCSLGDIYSLPQETDEQAREVLAAVTGLPQNYRAVIYLHFYEGYTAGEIGKIIHKNANTVYTWIGRAKERLRQALGGEDDA